MRTYLSAARAVSAGNNDVGLAVADSPALQRLSLLRARGIVGTYDGEADDENPEYDESYMDDSSDDELSDYFNEVFASDIPWNDIIPGEWEALYEWYMDTIYGV